MRNLTVTQYGNSSWTVTITRDEKDAIDDLEGYSVDDEGEWEEWQEVK